MLLYIDLNSLYHTVYLADFTIVGIYLLHIVLEILFSINMYSFVIDYSYISYNHKLFLSYFMKSFYNIKR